MAADDQGQTPDVNCVTGLSDLAGVFLKSKHVPLSNKQVIPLDKFDLNGTTGQMLHFISLIMFTELSVLSEHVNAVVDVQNLNQEVTAEGKKKVDVLQATKDFKKGIYGLQWEHTQGAMEVLNKPP